MHDGYAGQVRGLAEDVVALAQVVRARVVQEVGVVHKAGDGLAGKALQLALELYYLLRALGHGTKDVHDVVDLQLARLQRGEVLVIAREGQRPGLVAAHVEDDEVPVAVEGRGHLRGHHRLREALTDEGGRDDVDALVDEHLDVVGHPEIVVYPVEVDDLRALALRGREHGHVHGDLGLAGAVVAYEYDDLFHAHPPF